MKSSKLTLFRIIIAGAICLLPIMNLCSAEPSPENETEEPVENEEEVDENDARVRENPVIDGDDEIDIPVPDFIDQKDNRITYNGADWSELREAIADAERQPVSLLNIGDSHVQADFGTGTIRDLLQYDYGDAGRGIITPLKMAGTNEPYDYVFTSTGSWNGEKLATQNWSQTMGFTGTSIRFRGTTGDLTVGTSEKDDYDPFISVAVFHKGQMAVTSVTNTEGEEVKFGTKPGRDFTIIRLGSEQNRITIHFETDGDLTVFGVSLSGGRPGVYYHAIGNNSGTYSLYNKIGNVGRGIKPLSPKLIIISLGTNEAFGSVDETAFYNNIDRLVKNIQQENPEAEILLTTPMECQKSVYHTTSKKVAIRSRKGKKRYKTVSSRSRSYAVNDNCHLVRDIILRYGKDHKIATYDWYTVAGGNGAASKWISNGLFSKDHVHHSVKGYRLQGRLLYEALSDAFKKQLSN